MSLSRRQFLSRTGLASGALLLPPWLGNPLVRDAAASAGARSLVVIHLDGGNDGLNTVTPIDDGAGTLRTDYDANRALLRLPPASLLPIGLDASTGAQLGLNPALGGIEGLFQSGACAIVQGCGYPEPRLSHDGSNRVWRTGRPVLDASDPDGWVGRAMVELGYVGTDIPAVNIGRKVAPSFRQAVTNVLAFESLDDFGFPYDLDHPGDDLAKRACFASQCQAAMSAGPPQRRFVASTARSALEATEAFVASYENDRGGWVDLYDALGTAPAHDLREIAKILYGVSLGVPGMEARLFQMSATGYDTHANQGAGDPGDRHFELLRALGDALALFYDDCADMGIVDDVLVLVWSEFGRRVKQNGNGTDHGSVGPVLLVGGQVAGGIYGNHPDLSPGALDPQGNLAYSQDTANPHRSTDFRDVYGTVLARWLGVPEATILSDVLPPEPAEYDPAAYWVEGHHDFAMGFLPPPGS